MLSSYRHVVAAMIFLNCFVNYMGRLNLSTTIVAMTHENVEGDTPVGDVCPALEDSDHRPFMSNLTDESTMMIKLAALKEGEFDWDHTLVGIVLGSFFIGYAPFQVLGGRLADRFGPRWPCFAATLGTGVQNFLTPVLARWNVHVLIASRVMLGALQALVFPGCFTLASKWTPDHERSMVLSFTSIGGLVGSIVVSTLSGYLCKHNFAGGWPGVFYVTGAINTLFALIYIVLVSDSPESSYFVSQAERDHIRANIKAKRTIEPTLSDPEAKSGVVERIPATRFPWAKVFSNKAVYAIIFARFTMHWYYNLVTLKLPAYMQQVLRMPLEANGNYSSIIFLAMSFSHFVAGIAADRLTKSGRIRKTKVRKIFEGVGTLGTAVFFALISFTDCDRFAFLALMVGAMLTHGMQAGGEFPIASDLTNRFSATLFGLSNFIAMIPGIVMPYAIGAVLDAHPDRIRHQWWNIFYVISGVNVLGGIIFLVFATAEPQDWDWVEKEEEIGLDVNMNIEASSDKEDI